MAWGIQKLAASRLPPQPNYTTYIISNPTHHSPFLSILCYTYIHSSLSVSIFIDLVARSSTLFALRDRSAHYTGSAPAQLSSVSKLHSSVSRALSSSSFLFTIIYLIFFPFSVTMPHKVNNDSNSTLASGGSSSDQVIASEVRGMSIQ